MAETNVDAAAYAYETGLLKLFFNHLTSAGVMNCDGLKLVFGTPISALAGKTGAQYLADQLSSAEANNEIFLIEGGVKQMKQHVSQAAIQAACLE